MGCSLLAAPSDKIVPVELGCVFLETPYQVVESRQACQNLDQLSADPNIGLCGPSIRL